jgi:hypothetical protein
MCYQFGEDVEVDFLASIIAALFSELVSSEDRDFDSTS